MIKMRNQQIDNLTDSTHGRFAMGDFEQKLICIPPLAEQLRIVAKADTLMALCDRLEATLRTADTARARLLEAPLHETLAAPLEILEAAE